MCAGCDVWKPPGGRILQSLPHLTLLPLELLMLLALLLASTDGFTMGLAVGMAAGWTLGYLAGCDEKKGK